jgi:hypothetical protein
LWLLKAIILDPSGDQCALFAFIAQGVSSRRPVPSSLILTRAACVIPANSENTIHWPPLVLKGRPIERGQPPELASVAIGDVNPLLVNRAARRVPLERDHRAVRARLITPGMPLFRPQHG